MNVLRASDYRPKDRRGTGRSGRGAFHLLRHVEMPNKMVGKLIHFVGAGDALTSPVAPMRERKAESNSATLSCVT